MRVLKRGTRVFIAQVGFPEYGQHARIHGVVSNVADRPDDVWYRYRVEGERKLAGLICHESWVTVTDDRPDRHVQA